MTSAQQATGGLGVVRNDENGDPLTDEQGARVDLVELHEDSSDLVERLAALLAMFDTPREGYAYLSDPQRVLSQLTVVQ